MNLENTLFDLCEKLSLHDVDDEILLSFVLCHTANDEVGVFPTIDDPVKIIEYLLLGFFKECETLLMAKELCHLEDSDIGMCERILEVMKESYPYYDEVIKKIEIVNPDSMII